MWMEHLYSDPVFLRAAGFWQVWQKVTERQQARARMSNVIELHYYYKYYYMATTVRAF